MKLPVAPAVRPGSEGKLSRWDRLRRAMLPLDDVGMTTAEYAVGTVAACGFAGILYRLLTSEQVTKLLLDVIKRAIQAAF